MSALSPRNHHDNKKTRKSTEAAKQTTKRKKFFVSCEIFLHLIVSVCVFSQTRGGAVWVTDHRHVGECQRGNMPPLWFIVSWVAVRYTSPPTPAPVSVQESGSVVYTTVDFKAPRRPAERSARTQKAAKGASDSARGAEHDGTVEYSILAVHQWAPAEPRREPILNLTLHSKIIRLNVAFSIRFFFNVYIIQDWKHIVMSDSSAFGICYIFVIRSLATLKKVPNKVARECTYSTHMYSFILWLRSKVSFMFWL